MDVVDNVVGEFRETFHENPELTTAHLLLFYYHLKFCFKPKVGGIL
jgi:hypothetical protein